MLCTPLCTILFCLEMVLVFDAHYDLLTILYCCYLRNDFTYVERLQSDLGDVHSLIANLYFMNKDEMRDELQIEDINVVEMFKISTALFKKYFNGKKVLFSIEGCDYIKDEVELEQLYNLGLRNILLVWNNENKFGSGNRSDKGLTVLGEKLIRKAVKLGISIDLSHMNKNTFWDTIKLLNTLKNDGYNAKVLVSHSNSYSLCSNKRNLDDLQIKAIGELSGKIGVVLYGPFINEQGIDLEKCYLEHIKHISGIIGIDNIMIATDNMEFATEIFGIEEGSNLFGHKNIIKSLTNMLRNYYNEEEINKIIKINGERFIEER